MPQHKLHMLLLGCRAKGRNTEQHDIFFTIGSSLKELVPFINDFWPEVKGSMHIDVWREVTHVDGFKIKVIAREEALNKTEEKLFFINLGGYKEQEFEEYHYKVLVVAKTLDEAKTKAKETNFFKHVSIPGSAASHIDDKFGVDIDDVAEVNDILPVAFKQKYSLQITPTLSQQQDELHLGYLPLFRIS